jgi:hypothetical protein
VDILAKYVAKIYSGAGSKDEGLTFEKLAEAGFV